MTNFLSVELDLKHKQSEIQTEQKKHLNPNRWKYEAKSSERDNYYAIIGNEKDLKGQFKTGFS